MKIGDTKWRWTEWKDDIKTGPQFPALLPYWRSIGYWVHWWQSIKHRME